MKDPTSALLVYDHEYPLSDLRLLLDRLGFESLRARSCAEARRLLASPAPPHLAFTDTHLLDGGWAETVSFAARVRRPVPVIVVSRTVDLTLYLDALESGAAEFIVPPFRDADVSFVTEGALLSGTRTASASLRCPAQPAPTHRGDTGRSESLPAEKGIENLS